MQGFIIFNDHLFQLLWNSHVLRMIHLRPIVTMIKEALETGQHVSRRCPHPAVPAARRTQLTAQAGMAQKLFLTRIMQTV